MESGQRTRGSGFHYARPARGGTNTQGLRIPTSLARPGASPGNRHGCRGPAGQAGVGNVGLQPRATSRSRNVALTIGSAELASGRSFLASPYEVAQENQGTLTGAPDPCA